MTAAKFNSSAPCAWIKPRPVLTDARRHQIHGALQPMETQRKGFWAWLK